MTSPSPQDRVDGFLDALAAAGSPGCAVGVVRRGELVYERGVGLANLEYGIPITCQTPIHVASVSKQFTAFAIAHLATHGALGLDDDVRTYLPAVPDFGDTITLRQLVHHTSGLRDQWTVLLAAGWRMDDVITTQDILELFQQQTELNFAPGTNYSYSNTGYTLLGEVVGVVSGVSLRQYCDREIFAPLGMTQTHFHDDYTEVVPDRAYSYLLTQDGREPRHAGLNYGTVGATSLQTTVRDLARWEVNFSTEQVGGRAVLDQVHEVGVVTDGSPTGYAFGLIVDSHRGTQRVGHGGADAAFTSFVARFPEVGISLIAVANSSVVSAPKLVSEIADIYLDHLGFPAVDTGQPWHPDEDLVRRYEGLFADARSGTYVRLERHEDRLVVADGEKPTELEPLGDGRFQLPGNAEIRFGEIGGRPRLHTAALALVSFDLDLVEPASPSTVELSAYVGDYWSEELQIRYRIDVREGCLVLLRRKLAPISLDATTRDAFSGTWSDPRSPLKFVILFECLGDAAASFLLTFPRSQRMAFHRVNSGPAARPLEPAD